MTIRFMAAAAIALAVTTSTVSAQGIKLGALFPASGAFAVLGDESYRGLEIATEERNAAGGIKGKKIDLVKGDAVDTAQAVGEARRLISVEKVTAIFGTYASSLSLAATQVAELAGVPYFEMTALSDQITSRGFKYLFRTNPTAKDFAYGVVDGVVETLAPVLKTEPKDLRIAIIHEDSLTGQSVANYQIARAKEKGLNVVEVMPYSAKSVDLTPLILRLKSAKADVVLPTSFLNDTVLFLRQIKDQGYKPKAIIAGGAGYSMRDSMVAVGAENIEGAITIDFTQYNINPKAAPGIAEFVAKYEAKYGMRPRSGLSLATYMGGKVFFDVIEGAKDLSADAIRDAAKKADFPASASPTGYGAKFDETGQNIRAKPSLLQWQAGELVTVSPAEAAVSQLKVGIGAK